MKVLLDTSVLVSAMLPDHMHHGRTQPWLERAKARAFEAVVSGHSLAEVYAVLTRLPRTPGISPGEAMKLIQENVAPLTILTLAADDYMNLLKEQSQVGLAGGAVYDAVIAKVAELANVDWLLTLNLGHFQRAWPSRVNRIISPLAMTPLDAGA